MKINSKLEFIYHKGSKLKNVLLFYFFNDSFTVGIAHGSLHTPAKESLFNRMLDGKLR
jgi:hypothetical protein